jgi:hypothetical protein
MRGKESMATQGGQGDSGDTGNPVGMHIVRISSGAGGEKTVSAGESCQR